MTGFVTQNAAALSVGALTGAVCYYAFSDINLITALVIASTGFIGVHLPAIQQPSLPSYQVVRLASWLATLLVPITLFFYRPTDLIPALAITFLFTTGFWLLIDRVSLQRDFTHTLTGAIAFPLLVTAAACLAAGNTLLIPVFLASSLGYALRLYLDGSSPVTAMLTLGKNG